MRLGFSGEAFGNLLLLLGMGMLIFITTVSIVAHKKGINVTEKKFMLTLSMGAATIFVVIPLWLTELLFKDKIVISTIATLVGLANYYAIDRTQRALREHFGDKKKTDKDG